jgi:hypothetical protein
MDWLNINNTSQQRNQTWIIPLEFGRNAKESQIHREQLLRALEQIKTTHPFMFTTVDEISKEFGVSCSFRRGATADAFNAGSITT